MWIDDSDWPWPHHPLRLTVPDNEPVLTPDYTLTVGVFQLRPLTVDAFVAWSDGQMILVNGGPAVVLPDDGGIVGLGDYGVRENSFIRAEPAAGFAQRYTPVEP